MTYKSDNTNFSNKTPKSLGFTMPAEWGPHEATWLSWPTNSITWPDCLKAVEDIYMQMIQALTPYEKVHLLVDDEGVKEQILNRMLKNNIPEEQVRFFVIPTVDSWIRDYGPIFVRNKKGELAYTHWQFNAWGGKYEDLAQDNLVTEQLQIPYPEFKINRELEGGSVDVNGCGSVLTTEQCLLNPNRNSDLNKGQIESLLNENLGTKHVIWLGEGIVGDDTDGHIDDIARFVNPSTIVCAVESDPKDENYALLKDNLKRLNHSKDQDGKPLKIIELPMPGKIESSEGRLPASYANFYIANGVVLVPLYGHKNDKIALNILEDVFADRTVVGIPCAPLVLGLGAIHCVTQQQPKLT